MGCSQAETNELNPFIGNFSFIDEEKVKEGENLSLENSEKLNKQSKKSICQIIKGKGFGTGFFCKIKYIV